MKLSNVPVEFEGIRYTGRNAKAVEKFTAKNGLRFQVNGDTDKAIVLHLASGSVDLQPGMIVAAQPNSEMFVISPREVGDCFPAKYRILEDDVELAPVTTHPSAYVGPPAVDARLDKLEESIGLILDAIKK